MTAITRGTRSVFLLSLCELLRAPSATEAGHGCSSAALLPAGSGFPKVPCLQIPHCADNIAAVVSDFHVMQGCASPRDCPAPRVTTAPTTASVCWDQANLCVNWTASTVDRGVQWNCSGTTLECCHDKVWEKDAVEFYIAPGVNASWNRTTGVHNVTEVDGGPMGGLWQGYINNSGFSPNLPSFQIPCDANHASWKPFMTPHGFGGQLRIPWSMIPQAFMPNALPKSVWRLNFCECRCSVPLFLQLVRRRASATVNCF